MAASPLAARLLARQIDDRLAEQRIASFSDSVRRGAELGLIGDRLLARVDTEKGMRDAAAGGAAHPG